MSQRRSEKMTKKISPTRMEITGSMMGINRQVRGEVDTPRVVNESD